MLEWIRVFDRESVLTLNSWAQSTPLRADLTIFFARYAILLYALAIIYLFLKHKVKAVIVAMFAVGSAFLVEYLISAIRTRPRPFLVYNSIFRLDNVSGTISSFPSSHAVIVFAVSTSLLLYGHRRLGSALLILAVLVSVARVAAGVHYPSDVVVGAILGTATGFLTKNFVEASLSHHHEDEEPARQRRGKAKV